MNGDSAIFDLVSIMMILGGDVARLGHIFGSLTLETSSMTPLLSSKTDNEAMVLLLSNHIHDLAFLAPIPSMEAPLWLQFSAYASWPTLLEEF